VEQAPTHPVRESKGGTHLQAEVGPLLRLEGARTVEQRLEILHLGQQQGEHLLPLEHGNGITMTDTATQQHRDADTATQRQRCERGVDAWYEGGWRGSECSHTCSKSISSNRLPPALDRRLL
jgi:hypothetical protein